MKMCIEDKSIRIAYIHNECALTTICIECTFNQSTSTGGLEPVSYRIAVIASSSYRHVLYCVCHYNCAISKLNRIK